MLVFLWNLGRQFSLSACLSSFSQTQNVCNLVQQLWMICVVCAKFGFFCVPLTQVYQVDLILPTNKICHVWLPWLVLLCTYLFLLCYHTCFWSTSIGGSIILDCLLGSPRVLMKPAPSDVLRLKKAQLRSPQGLPRPNPTVGFGRTRSDLVGFGRIWTDLDGFGRIWSDLNFW